MPQSTWHSPFLWSHRQSLFVEDKAFHSIAICKCLQGIIRLKKTLVCGWQKTKWLWLKIWWEFITKLRQLARQFGWWDRVQSLWQQYRGSSEIRTTTWSSILLMGIYLKELKSGSQRDICTIMLTVVLFTTAKTWKQPKCLSELNEQRKCTIYTWWNIIQPLKRKSCNNTDELEDVMLSEISQTQKDKYCMLTSIWEI